IKVLEERVGAPLFLRRPRQIVLTEAGQRLAPAVSEAFAILGQAYAAVRGGADGLLCVTTVLTFASNWLAHRLGSFQIAHPSLAVRLAASIGGVNEPADLLRLPILDPGDIWWTEWFSAAGVHSHDLARRPGSSMGAQAYEANAAIAGHGVAILTRALFKAELADGRLIQPFDLVGDDGHAYWLVYPQTRRNVPKIRAFRDWLLAEIAC
ncbi:MAG: LysR family transcriptional regulator, partial [Mesorhizobium sp.]